MSWHIEFDGKRKIVILNYQGYVSKTNIHESGVAVVTAMHDKHIHKTLTDLTDARILAVSTVDIVGLFLDYEVSGLNIQYTVAIVVPKNSKIRNDVELYEMICKNGPIKVHVFEDRDQALNWLENDGSKEVQGTQDT
jgi:hypothetical protein